MRLILSTNELRHKGKIQPQVSPGLVAFLVLRSCCDALGGIGELRLGFRRELGEFHEVLFARGKELIREGKALLDDFGRGREREVLNFLGIDGRNLGHELGDRAEGLHIEFLRLLEAVEELGLGLFEKLIDGVHVLSIPSDTMVCQQREGLRVRSLL